ncbi:MAG: hypothetical protein JSV80_04310 [Acidobacteriota bacterium]|nr:MAG: hypothetical protein JSV80_04310 [Acidobacteriota bacterium]
MWKKVMAAGLLSAIVLMAWVLVTNGVLGLRSRYAMKPIPNEWQLHDQLKERLAEPGRYVCPLRPRETSSSSPPPELPSELLEQPVFSIQFSGLGHENAGQVAAAHFAIALIAPIVAAWMLATSGGWFLSRYARRVLFFALLGLIIALVGEFRQFDLGGYPFGTAVLFAVQELVGWTLAGLVAGAVLRPEPA